MCIYAFNMEMNEYCHCYAIRQLSTKITKIYDEALLESGLKITQYAILKYISNLKNTNLNKLSISMGYNRTTLGRNIRILERKELIYLDKGKDKRALDIRITKNGLKILNVAAKCWKKINTEITKKLGINKKKMIEEILYDKNL